MNHEIKIESVNYIKDKKQEINMDFLTRLTRTFFRLFSLQTFAIFLIISMGSFIIIWNFFPNIEDKLFSSIITAFILTFIAKYFEYYGD